MRNLLPSFAMEMGRPVDEVEAVTMFFFGALRQELSSLKSTVIHVENLGNFYVKRNCLDATIKSMEKRIEKLSNTDIREYSSKQELKTSLEKMKNLVNLLEEEKQRRVEIIKKRYDELDKDMED